MPRLPLLGKVLLIVVTTAHSSSATTKMSPPKAQDVAGVWIGGTVGSELEFLRLELDAEGKGVLTLSELPDTPVMAYQVQATRLKEFEVSFDLTPVDSRSEPISLRGKFLYSRMLLTLSGVTLTWKRDIYLRNQEGFMKRLRAAENRAKEIPRVSSRRK